MYALQNARGFVTTGGEKGGREGLSFLQGDAPMDSERLHSIFPALAAGEGKRL